MTNSKTKQFSLEQEYSKPTEVSPPHIARLRDWIRTQPHLPEQYITDLDIICAFHACNKSMEVTKQVLDLNYTLKTSFSELFGNRVFDSRTDMALHTMLLHPLTVRAHNGCACFYATFLDSDVKKFVFCDVMRTALIILDLLQYEQGTWPGIMVFIDLKGFTFSHLTRLDVKTLQQFFYYIQEALLMKLKSIHFLNAPSFMNKLMMILKPFLKQELMESIYIYESGSQELNKFYPIEAIPSENDYKRHQDDIIKKLKMNSEFFEKDNKKRVNELLRPEKYKASRHFDGIIGSFKNIEFD